MKPPIEYRPNRGMTTKAPAPKPAARAKAKAPVKRQAKPAKPTPKPAPRPKRDRGEYQAQMMRDVRAAKKLGVTTSEYRAMKAEEPAK